MENKAIEARNLNEVSALLLNREFMVYRPEADVGGVDFLVKTPTEKILCCQLKSWAYVQWNKYGNKDIYMVFPGKGDPFQREWYLIPHDKLFGILKSKHGGAPKWNHPKFGEYWHCPVSSNLAEEMSGFALKS